MGNLIPPMKNAKNSADTLREVIELLNDLEHDERIRVLKGTAGFFNLEEGDLF